MKDKIISLAITAMLMLAGWNLHETYIMSKQMVKKTNNFVKNKFKKQQKKNKKKKKKDRE